MQPLVNFWEDFWSFIYAGGDILLIIFVVTFWMWALLVERIWYYWRIHPGVMKSELQTWTTRSDKSSWYAQQVRRMMVSRMFAKLNQGLPMLRTLVALAPLLGLLGTVTGMIEVFQIMSLAGSGNPRAMASGVSRATIPTMAGMVAALSGMYFISRMQRTVTRESAKFEDHLTKVG